MIISSWSWEWALTAKAEGRKFVSDKDQPTNHMVTPLYPPSNFYFQGADKLTMLYNITTHAHHNTNNEFLVVGKKIKDAALFVFIGPTLGQCDCEAPCHWSSSRGQEVKVIKLSRLLDAIWRNLFKEIHTRLFHSYTAEINFQTTVLTFMNIHLNIQYCIAIKLYPNK